ncbi:MAG: hypothetical protein QFF03_00190 [Pseudomonadota bacterium]|nr:hypothetical protein [Pseudomonadota bacterium]
MQLDPQCFPDPRSLGNRAMALAMLDAIICPEFEYRYFNYDGAWGDDEQMASMHNGDGDHWFLHVGEHGAAIKGYVQDLPRGAAGAMAQRVQRALPGEFAGFLREPSFEMDAVSYCYWRRSGDAAWSKVVHPDAGLAHWSDRSADYLSILLAPADCYYEYATDYFECEPPLASIEHIYALAPLTAAIVKSLNPHLTLAEAQAAAAAIGYPRMAAQASLAC